MAGTQTPTAPTKSKRDLFGERLKKKYPDKEYADDEAMWSQANDDYDDYDKQIGEYQGREQRMMDLFSKDPSSAGFLNDMAEGKDPWIAVINRLGIDGVTEILNDPAKQKEYAAENKKYLERVAKSKQLEKDFNANIAESLSMVDQVQQERGLGDETVDAAYDLIERIAGEAILGKITRETFEIALNAVNRDADIENARAEGTVAGRNAKIDEKLRKPKTGDGTPTLAGSNNAPTRQGKKTLNIFDYVDAAK